MGFFSNLVKTFKEAAKAGSDFTPEMEGVLQKIEELHAQGKLDDVVYKAEQAYEKEHAEYLAKGTHTNAQDSQNDSAALKHFLDTLKADMPHLDPSIREHAAKLLELRDKMENILGNLIKK